MAAWLFRCSAWPKWRKCQRTRLWSRVTIPISSGLNLAVDRGWPTCSAGLLSATPRSQWSAPARAGSPRSGPIASWEPRWLIGSNPPSQVTKGQPFSFGGSASQPAVLPPLRSDFRITHRDLARGPRLGQMIPGRLRSASTRPKARSRSGAGSVAPNRRRISSAVAPSNARGAEPRPAGRLARTFRPPEGRRRARVRQLADHNVGAIIGRHVGPCRSSFWSGARYSGLKLSTKCSRPWAPPADKFLAYW
jgi:hypothetical protein